MSYLSNNTDKARVILLSGFLGSGKTTLLNCIASTEQDMTGTVIIVNEFGRLGIDGSLLKGENYEVIELTSGCICCTLALDLTKTLMDISHRFQPHLILVEASGVADPKSVSAVFKNSEIRERMMLEKTITVLDADCWKMRRILGSLFYLQLEAADVILVNKIDLVNAEAIAQVLNQIHHNYPQAQVLPTIHCRIDPELIFIKDKKNTEHLWDKEMREFNDFYALNPPCAPPIGVECSQAPVTYPEYVAFSFQDPRVMHAEAFKRFITALPIEVFRIKGSVHFQDKTVLFNHAGGKSDWSTWKGAPETRLAFVGWNIKPEETIRALKECLITPPDLRSNNLLQFSKNNLQP